MIAERGTMIAERGTMIAERGTMMATGRGMGAPVLLAAGAIKTALERLLEGGAWHGAPPVIHYGTAGALRDRVLAGEAADVVVTSEAHLATLPIIPGSQVPMGAAGTGLAASDGAPRRPIGDAASFRAALLASASIGWADPASGATGGRHFEKVIEALGIATAIRAKGRLYDFGVNAVAACGRGEVELAVSQATEIIGRPGVSLLGLFPPPHDLSTRYAAAALCETEGARALLALLSGPAARAALADIGFTMEDPR
jgi:molybdate transport system substrate-binding protein